MLHNTQKKDVYSPKDGVVLSSRHMSFACSAALLCLFLAFIAGYFLGQKNAVDRFYSKVEQESFADQVYSSLCMMHENSENEQNDTEEVPEAAERIVVREEAVEENKVVHVQNALPAEVASVQEGSPTQQYYAQLVGFGTEQAARQFVQRLHKKNIEVVVKKRRSKTAKGKAMFWYQVVTPVFQDRDELSGVVDIISQQEHLKGVRIVTC